MIAIRRAIAADVPWLLEQLRAFDAFYGTRKSLFPSDPDRAHQIVSDLVDTQPFFIAERDATPLGFVAGALYPHPYNPERRLLSELFWWVSPSHRFTSAAARLLDHFIAFGRAHADWIVMTLEAQSPVDDRILRKRGFVPHERSLLLEV